MKRFHFQLEKVLELKKHIENRWEIKLGEATAKCEKVKMEIKNLDKLKKEAFLGRLSRDLQHVALTEQYVNFLTSRIGLLNNELKSYEHERRKVLEKFITATRDRKKYDTLKEKRAAEFHKSELKKEFLEIDDMNNNAVARRSGG